MQDSLLSILLIIGSSVAGSFLGLLCYSRYEHRQRIDKIRCLVTTDVSQIFNAIKNIMIEISDEKEQTQTVESFKQFLTRNIITIDKIAAGTAVNLYGKYFHLPTEEMFKFELLYRDLSKFNEKMKLLGKELHKYEIKDVMAKKTCCLSNYLKNV